MTSLYKILKSAKLGAGAAQDFHTAIMAQKMPFAKGSGAEHEYTGAVPVTFTANGQPLLDYLISGNTVQNGTPTPDNPVMPQGTGERTGNLLDFYALQNAPSGTIGSSACNHVLELVLEANTTYTCISNGSGSTSGSADDNRSIYFNNSDATNVVYSGHSVTVTTGADGKVKIGFFSSRANAQQYINGSAQAWLVKGSVPLSYEPYGYKIPISSANTTTPVYLGEVETTRRVKKLVLTGNESINYSSTYNRFSIPIPDFETMGVRITPFVMSHYIVIDDGRPLSDVPNNGAYSGAASDNHLIFVKTTSYTSSDGFKSYLAAQYAAGTPVCVWYVLANEETGIVNEPLMKIGDYADTLSMEQAGVEIPTTKGSTTLDVETTIKPSEVYIKYKS